MSLQSSPNQTETFTANSIFDLSSLSRNWRLLSFSLSLVLFCLGYFVVLNKALPADILWASYHSLIWTAAPAGVVLYFAYHRSGLLANSIALTLTLALFALPLLALWQHAGQHPSVLGGLLPSSDASGYYHEARRLLNEQLLGWGARRPLFVVLLAVLLRLTGENLQVAITCLVALNALACFLLAREVRATHGALAAVIALLILFFFFRHVGGTGTTLTENLGFALGVGGFAVLWRGAYQENSRIVWLGVAIISLAQCARPAGIFALPALVLAGAWAFRQQSHFLKQFLWGCTAVGIMFALDSVIRKALSDPSTQGFSNFAYPLYGLIVGGKGWQQIMIDHPNAREGKEMYDLAFQAFRANPMALITGSLKMWQEYFSPRSYHAFSFLNASHWSTTFIQLSCYGLSGVGLVQCLLRYRTPYQLLLLAAALGHLASIPFAPPTDAGLRIYAATMPVLALLVALGGQEMLRLATQLLRRVELLPEADSPDIPLVTGNSFAARWGVCSLFGLILVLLLPTSALFVRLTSRALKFETSACQAGQEALQVRLSNGSALRVVESDSTLDKLLQRGGVTSYHITEIAGSPTTVEVHRTGRYVRVQLNGVNYLSLAEVQVFDDSAPTPINLAAEKTAAQSSTANGGTARRAIDRNTNGDWGADSVTGTDHELQPWWEVDLGASRKITRIAIWNRTECCQDRLRNFYVLVSETPFLSSPRVLPEITIEKLRATQLAELTKEAEYLTPPQTIINAYDLKGNRLVWLIAPTSLLPTQTGFVQVCGSYSNIPWSKEHNVFHADSIKSINVNSR